MEDVYKSGILIPIVSQWLRKINKLNLSVNTYSHFIVMLCLLWIIQRVQLDDPGTAHLRPQFEAQDKSMIQFETCLVSSLYTYVCGPHWLVTIPYTVDGFIFLHRSHRRLLPLYFID